MPEDPQQLTSGLLVIRPQ